MTTGCFRKTNIGALSMESGLGARQRNCKTDSGGLRYRSPTLKRSVPLPVAFRTSAKKVRLLRLPTRVFCQIYSSIDR